MVRLDFVVQLSFFLHSDDLEFFLNSNPSLPAELEHGLCLRSGILIAPSPTMYDAVFRGGQVSFNAGRMTLSTQSCSIAPATIVVFRITQIVHNTLRRVFWPPYKYVSAEMYAGCGSTRKVQYLLANMPVGVSLSRSPAFPRHEVK